MSHCCKCECHCKCGCSCKCVFDSCRDKSGPYRYVPGLGRPQYEVFDGVQGSLYDQVYVSHSSTYFFSTPRGQTMEGGEDLGRRVKTYTRTNIENSNVVLSNKAFKFNTVRFWLAQPEAPRAREKMLRDGYFEIWICDHVIITFPIHLMQHYYRYFEKEFSKPITLNPYENFLVQLRLDDIGESFPGFLITCELVGDLRRVT